MLAEGVASELGIPCISREIVVAAADAAGVPETVLAEQFNRAPTVFHRHSRERDAYLWFIRSVLYQRASEGSFVYHGHGGHFLLADIPNLLRVGVVAPMEFRIAGVMESHGLDHTAAEKHVQQTDKFRDQWVRHLYGVDWLDPSFYDLMINLKTLDTREACELLTRTAQFERFAQTDESRQKVADVALATRVTAVLAMGGELALGRLELTARAGVLTIDGQARSSTARDDIRTAAENAIGEAELRFQVAVGAQSVTWGFEHRQSG